MGIWDWVSDWLFEGGGNDPTAKGKWVIIGRSQHTETKHLLAVTSEDTCNCVTAWLRQFRTVRISLWANIGGSDK